MTLINRNSSPFPAALEEGDSVTLVLKTLRLAEGDPVGVQLLVDLLLGEPGLELVLEWESRSWTLHES